MFTVQRIFSFCCRTIDGYLKSSLSLPDETIHLLFSANRWETVDNLLHQLNSGVDIVCDRYAYSGIAYSAAKGLDFEWCRAPDCGLPEPDLVMYMNVSAEVARHRGGYGEERYEKEEFQSRVGKQFVALGRTEGSRWKIVNADRDADTISKDVLELSLAIPPSVLKQSVNKLWMKDLSKKMSDTTSSTPELRVPAISSISGLVPGPALVTLRCRIHSIRKQGAKLVFIVLRGDGGETVQGTVFGSFDHALFTRESVVDVYGTVVTPPEPLRGCARSDIEIRVERIECISQSVSPLPIQYHETNSLETRLNNRVIDLRNEANQEIFQIQAKIVHVFTNFFEQMKFLQIHSPKLVSGASEGGSSVFTLKYFDQTASLAQSPQLYKQMALLGDFPNGVFEIGPVFRAESSFTHRHLTEFTGLDFEMKISDFSDISNLVDSLFNDIFSKINKETIRWSYPCLKLEFDAALDLLRLHGPALLQLDIANCADPNRVNELRAHLNSLNSLSDLGTSDEKLLGRIISKVHQTDFYMITKFPTNLRPFYTMPCEENEQYSNSYDVYLRGEEIMSGAQRIHDYEMLRESVEKNGIDEESIKDYLNAFKYGSFPHGGGGIGLERLVMLYLGLPDIRLTSMFPRDPNRLSP